MKRSSPKRNVPRGPQVPPHKSSQSSGVGITGRRSRTDFAGSSARRTARSGFGNSPQGRKLAEWQDETQRRIDADEPVPPKAPPVCVIYEDLLDPDEMAARAEGTPLAIYGQYPKALIAKMLPWLRCERHEILHVCSGSLPPGEGIRVDIRETAKPDILADGRDLHMIPTGTIKAWMGDPPYSEDYAKSLYGVEYPRPAHLLAEAARVVVPGGRIAIVHYITPKPPPGCRFVKAFGLSTGFDMPMRAVSIYEKEHAQLPGLA